MNETLTQAIRNYINERKLAKLEPDQKKLDRALAKGTDAEQQQAKAQFAESEAKWNQVFEPATWLTDAARRAKQISLSTHSIKFIHSDAKSSSCLHLEVDAESEYLASHSLCEKVLDANCNAALLGFAKLLKIQGDGRCLVDELREGNVNSLKPFSSDENLHQAWFEGFSLALSDSRVTSHNLAKQVYFPVSKNEYHLLLPLYASSLAHQLHQKVTHTHFSESAKEIREAKRKEHYCEGVDVSYPKTVIQTFGGSQPQNISQLNSERYGNNYLLPCSPPDWHSQTKPLYFVTSLFDRNFSRSTYYLVLEFRRFLENLKPHQKNIEIRERRDKKYLQPIIDAVFARAAHFQSMQEYSGWSESADCQLKTHYKLWLDVWNTDIHFQQQREKHEWQSQVTADFSRWLNHALNKSKTYMLADEEQQYWQKLFAKQLKEFDWATPTAEVAL